MTTPVSAYVEMQQLLRPYDTSGRCALYGRYQNAVVIFDDVHLGHQRGIPLTTTYEEGWFYQQDEAASKARSPDRGGLGAVRLLQVMSTTKAGGALPLRDVEGEPDDRFAAWDSPGAPLVEQTGISRSYTKPRPQKKGPGEAQEAGLLSTRLPGGHPSLLVRASEESGLHLLRAGLWPGFLVADHDSATQGDLSSLVLDCDDGEVADGRSGRESRAASLDTAFKAEPVWHPQGQERASVSWWAAVDKARPGVGRGLMTSAGPFADNADDPALGYMGESGGGPLSAGAGFADKHLVALNRDGRAIVQGHLLLEAPWYLDSRIDAPPEVDRVPWQHPQTAGLPWHTFLRYDDEPFHRILGKEAGGGAANGLLRWQTPVPLFIPDTDRRWPPFPPPPFPPPPPGGKGKNGPGGGGNGPGGSSPFPPGGGLVFPQPVVPLPPAASYRSVGPVKTLSEALGSLPKRPGYSQPPGRAAVVLAPPERVSEGSTGLAQSASRHGREIQAWGLDDDRRAARETIGAIAELDSQVWAYNELGLSAVALRPASYRDNLLYKLRGISPELVASRHKSTPVVGRLVALGAESGKSWSYSARGTNARYRSGHAEGGFWVMPPENDPRFDCPDDHSLVSLGLWCAALDFATPLQSTGRGKSGFRFRLDDGFLKLFALSAAGEETELLSISSTGSITEPTTSVSGTFTTLPGFVHFVTCTTAAETTLPASGTVPEGTRVTYVGDGLTGTNDLKIYRGGSDTINGATALSLTTNYATATLILRGTEWRRIAS